MRASFLLLVSSTLSASLLACGSGDNETNGIGSSGGNGSGGTGSGAVGPGSGGTSIITVSGGSSSGGDSSGGTAAGGSGNATFELPSDYAPAENGSGWKLGDPVTATSMPPEQGVCNNTITGIVRDFQGLPDGHPNFEMDLMQFRVQKGIVADDVDDGRKPVYAPAGATTFTTDADAFNQWYRTTPEVNQPFYLTLWLAPTSTANLFTFESHRFFPLDGAGYGDSGADMEGNMHNFHFTSEFHTSFVYHGGETFTFIGDDDVWVFINHKLAVDLGGVHPQQTGETDLDRDAKKLGITVGQSYELDLFHAERHTFDSNFRVDTSIDFTNCGVIVPDKPPR